MSLADFVIGGLFVIAVIVIPASYIYASRSNRRRKAMTARQLAMLERTGKPVGLVISLNKTLSPEEVEELKTKFEKTFRAERDNTLRVLPYEPPSVYEQKPKRTRGWASRGVDDIPVDRIMDPSDTNTDGDNSGETSFSNASD